MTEVKAGILKPGITKIKHQTYIKAGSYLRRKHKHKYGSLQLSQQNKFIIFIRNLTFAEEFLVSAANVQYNIDRD